MIANIESLSQFEDIMSNKEKHDKEHIFVDFYAEWCGPCKIVMPEIIKMSEKYTNVKFVKICIDGNEELEQLADIYNISKVPTFMVFKTEQEDNEPVYQQIGPDVNKLTFCLDSLDTKKTEDF